MAALNFPSSPALNDTYGGFKWDGSKWVTQSVVQNIGTETHNASSKTTPVDLDEIPLSDSAASYLLKKLTWANLKATLKTYFDGLYPSGSGSSTGTNTGDNSTNTQYSSLVTNATHTGDATGSGALTVVALNGTNLAGLATGILKNTTTTGIPSIASSGTDYTSPTGTENLSNKTITSSTGAFTTLTKNSIDVGYLEIPQNSQSTAYTAVIGDSGKHLLHPSADTTARTFTIPANSSVAYPIGTALTFVNQASAGVMTIAITTDTMRLAGPGTTGSRTLAANGIATALKLTSTEWIISGTGLT